MGNARFGGSTHSGSRSKRISSDTKDSPNASARRALGTTAAIRGLASSPASSEARPNGRQAGEFHGVRVLLVDRQKLFAEVILSVLEELGAEVLQPVHEPDEALAAARRFHPDLMLVDLTINNGSGTGLCLDVRRECPDVKIVALSARNHTAESDPSPSGFHSCVSRDIPLQQFVIALRAALQGDALPLHKRALVGRESRTPEQRQAEMLSDHLTPREREVLALLIEGVTSSEMARKLSASPNTVRTHIQSILTKLQVHSRLEAATFAVRHGLVRIPGEREYARTADASNGFDVDGIRRWRGERTASRA